MAWSTHRLAARFLVCAALLDLLRHERGVTIDTDALTLRFDR